MKTEFELLAPAGSYEILKAVIEAGADAVYVGGSQFGARAYANNFTEEELLEAIDYVHLRGKKLFLTVNTLFKNQELEQQLYEYLLPYYERGLDAVIVQDLGVLQEIKTYFPDLPIHTSTQMTVTGVEGAKLMKQLGAERVVLARELSIAEMKQIRKETGVELEVFVHGALCYSYSGQCLFSSMLGGRSGNRGRCAQPCRLPYAVLDEKKKEKKKESYILSLKDLCGIEYLQKLREASVYSLKIEGRMKQASYAAGVVSFYRKYIDLEKQVTKEDFKHLYELGNRCGFTTEYFQKQNDSDMVTYVKPSYEKSNEALHQEIEKKYVGVKNQLPIMGTLLAYKGQPLELYLNYEDIHIRAALGEVQEAKNKPLEEADVRERMKKTGETPFYFSELSIYMDTDIFVPNGVCNQLRRETLAKLEETLLAGYRRKVSEREKQQTQMVVESKKQIEKAYWIASCENREQWKVLLTTEWIDTIYADVQMYSIDSMFSSIKSDAEAAHQAQKTFYLKLPVIFREATAQRYRALAKELSALPLDGIVVCNYEELQFVKEHLSQFPIVTDHNLYAYNDVAKQTFHMIGAQRDTIPLELNQKELRKRENTGSEMVVYGYYPLMISAGCVHKNADRCDKHSQITYLKDRYQVLFPVKNYCNDCYNVVYNSVPTCLYGELETLKGYGISHFRLAFTLENAKETENVLCLIAGSGHQIEHTKGHWKRGVE